MSVSKNSDIKKYYAGEVSDYTNQYSDNYAGYPANRIRLEILLRRIKAAGAQTLLDCGCGEGTPLAQIAASGVSVCGFDFVPEMVEQANQNCRLGGNVWVGNIMNPSDLKGMVDVTIALGVFPHLTDDVKALRNMAAVTKVGGRIFCSFRNELFNAFTLNRHSYEFFTKTLNVEDINGTLEKFFKMDEPTIREYDKILSRFHNPLLASALFAKAGLRVDRLHFYHFHAFPPLFEQFDPQRFRELSIAMEDPDDWRGYFMASAYVVEAVKEI